jgi:hypothetical protein
VQAKIHNAYQQLRQGEKIRLSTAAFVLSFCAASAFFWDREFPSGFEFLSQENAATCSHTWRASAFDLLDQSQRADQDPQPLDIIIARLILADLVYNMEGISARFRYNQSAARAAAYEMGLHLIDLPDRVVDQDTNADRETKRRVWWYLASTDWWVAIVLVSQRIWILTWPLHIGFWAPWEVLPVGYTLLIQDICG